MNPVEVAELLSCKRLLIFDFDGTLVDSSHLHSRAFNDAFSIYGIPVDYNSIAGMTTAAAVEKICGEAGLVLNDQERLALISDKQHRARELIETELRPLAGSVEFVRGARRHFTLALSTSASRRTVDASLKRLAIADCFDSVFTAEDVANGKPAPDLFLKALDRHRTDPTEALVFEDAESGLAAARAARLHVIRIVAENPASDAATWPILNEALRGLGW